MTARVTSLFQRSVVALTGLAAVIGVAGALALPAHAAPGTAGPTNTTVGVEDQFVQGLPTKVSQRDAQREQQRQNQQDRRGENVDPVTGETVKKSSVVQYVNAIYRWAAVIGGLLAVLMLIYAGYRYMTSYGDPEKIADAKDIVEKTLIGLALLILAALILNTINPRTVSDPCKPGDRQCGDIDFTNPKG